MGAGTSTLDYNHILLPLLAEKVRLVQDWERRVPTNFIIYYLGLLASHHARDSQGYSGCQFDLWTQQYCQIRTVNGAKCWWHNYEKNTALKFNQIHILQWSTRPSRISNLSHQQWWKNPTISHSSLTTRQCVGCVGFATFCRSWLGGSTGLWTAWAQLHLQCGWPSSRARMPRHDVNRSGKCGRPWLVALPNLCCVNKAGGTVLAALIDTLPVGYLILLNHRCRLNESLDTWGMIH